MAKPAWAHLIQRGARVHCLALQCGETGAPDGHEGATAVGVEEGAHRDGYFEAWRCDGLLVQQANRDNNTQFIVGEYNNREGGDGVV